MPMITYKILAAGLDSDDASAADQNADPWSSDSDDDGGRYYRRNHGFHRRTYDSDDDVAADDGRIVSVRSSIPILHPLSHGLRPSGRLTGVVVASRRRDVAITPGGPFVLAERTEVVAIFTSGRSANSLATLMLGLALAQGRSSRRHAGSGGGNHFHNF